MSYLDNASTSWPKPEQIKTALRDWLEQGCGSPGRGNHAFALAAADTVTNTRRRLARFFNFHSPHRLIFTASATDALNLAFKGFLAQGDGVLISSMEHNSVLRPLRHLEREGKIHVHILPCDALGRLDPEAVRRCLKQYAIRLVVLSHASNVTGTVQAVEQIGAIVREQGAYLLLDAAQTAGILPIDFQQLQIDILVSSGHKGLYGLQGTGIVLIGERIQELRTWREGGTGFNSLSEEQPRAWPEAFEAGTPNIPGILSLNAGVSFIEEQGLIRLRHKEKMLFQQLWEGIKSIKGIRCYGPPPGEDRIAILSCNMEDWEPEDLGALLNHNYGIQTRVGLHCAPLAHRTLGTLPLGTLRFSPSLFSSPEDIQQAIEALHTIASTALP